MKTRFTVHPKSAHWHAQPFSPLWAGLARDKSQHALELKRRNAEKERKTRRQPSSGSVHSGRVTQICPTVPSGVPGFLRPSPGVLFTPGRLLRQRLSLIFTTPSQTGPRRVRWELDAVTERVLESLMMMLVQASAPLIPGTRPPSNLEPHTGVKSQDR